MMKAVIDSGTMITLSSTCLMNVFRMFVKHNDIDLMVSDTVAQESVWRPITNKRFALNAARIKFAFNDKLIKVVASTPDVVKVSQEVLRLSNNSFFVNGKALALLQAGEAEALALAKIYGAKALFVDERTTRSLIENPTRLKEVLEKRQNEKITMNQDNTSKFREMFKDLKMFRSVDLIAMAYEQDLFDHELDHGKLELEAALYAAKFAGCAVSEMEIQDYLGGKK